VCGEIFEKAEPCEECKWLKCPHCAACLCSLSDKEKFIAIAVRLSNITRAVSIPSDVWNKWYDYLKKLKEKESLRFEVGTEPWEKRLREALEKGEKPVNVYCFGTKEFKILGNRVRLFRRGRWFEYECKDYYDVCPVCGRLMHVYYIPGTTFLACCSEECYKKYEQISEER